jgi:putative copper export protein|tara:strand:- start:904 stop:1389 length:486 start_codon:yes stop_codon:yes gene_type:complete
MDALDWILFGIRWGHAVSAVAWVGGGIFYLMVLRPAIRQSQGLPKDTGRAIGVEFRGLVSTAIAVLLITGVILSASRLTEDVITSPYVVVLVVKIALALYMFYVVRFMRQDSYPEDRTLGDSRWQRLSGRLTGTTAILVTGIVVIGLSDILDGLLENALVK